MAYGIGVSADLDYLHDPQQQRPSGHCQECGGEIWAHDEEICERCKGRRRSRPQTVEAVHVFTVTASAPMMRGLRTWLENRGYKYEEEECADV